MNNTPELLFGYLRDMIYAPGKASLDVDALDPEYKSLGQGLVTLARFLDEQRAFAGALARGELTAPLPSRDNEMAAPLKALQASLKHMTWQSQQVAMGDYQQRIDFMGEFADAFNTMTEQLDTRQKALEREIEAGRVKAEALEESNRLMTSLTANLSQIIIVVDLGGQVLYQNQAAEDAASMIDLLPAIQRSLQNVRAEGQGGETEFQLFAGDMPRHFAMHYYALHWQGQAATACVIQDISADRALVQELESRANWDAMTLLSNRFYGMHQLREWLDQKRAFTLCFIDLDNLKYVNDTFGHNEGDLYIITAANLLRDFSEDAVASRIGGDEFMLLCPDLTAQQAEEQIECTRLQLQQEFVQMDKAYYVNMSYGIVQVDSCTPLSASEVLSIADERMYQHKRQQKSLRPVQKPGASSD